MKFLPEKRAFTKPTDRSSAARAGMTSIAVFISFFLFVSLFASPFASLFVSISPAYAGEIVERVKREESVIVGITTDTPPFSYSTDDKGYPIGFDVEIAEAILDEINLKPIFVVVDPLELIPLVAEGEIQMAPGLAHRMSWERVIDFSTTYFIGGTGIVVKRSSSITKLSHLKRKKIALPPGISESEVSSMIEGVLIVPTDDVSTGFELLKGRKVVGVAGNIRDILKIVSEEEKPERFIIVEERLSKIPYAVGVPPSDARWKEMVDFSMMKMFESGLYSKIYEKWFGRYSRLKYPIGFTMEIWPK